MDKGSPWPDEALCFWEAPAPAAVFEALLQTQTEHRGSYWFHTVVVCAGFLFPFRVIEGEDSKIHCNFEICSYGAITMSTNNIN